MCNNMKKILSISIHLVTIFSTKISAREGWYNGPGIEIGIDTNGNTHCSA